MSVTRTKTQTIPRPSLSNFPKGERFKDVAPGAIAVAMFLLLWEFGSRAALIDPRSIPSMSATVAELLALSRTFMFWTAVGDTLRGWALGLGIAALLSIPLGLLIGANELLYRALRVPIEFLRPIPSVSLVPIALLVFGIGHGSKAFLASFAAFWPLLVQTMYGVKDVDPVALDTAKSFKLTRLRTLLYVVLPSAFPYIATGIRISSSVSLILAVTAEVVIGSPGLGKEINVARSSADIAGMYAFIVAIGIIGWALNEVALRFEKSALHWHASNRSTAP